MTRIVCYYVDNVYKCAATFDAVEWMTQDVTKTDVLKSKENNNKDDEHFHQYSFEDGFSIQAQQD